MGVEILEHGFKNTLSPEVPAYASRAMVEGADALAAEHGAKREDIKHFMLHPGGAKVLDAIQEAFSLSKEQMAPSRDTMAAIGNVSAPTVLCTLDDAMRSRRPPAGTLSLLAGRLRKPVPELSRVAVMWSGSLSAPAEGLAMSRIVPSAQPSPMSQFPLGAEANSIKAPNTSE